MKRIVFYLDKNTYDYLKQAAFKAGVSQSSVLRNWIKETELISFHPKNNLGEKKTVLYNFRLSDELLEQLDDICLFYKSNRSETLRLIIKSKTSPKQYSCNYNNHSIVNNRATLESLWVKGKLKEVIEVLDRPVQNLNDRELMISIKANFELGNYDKAMDLNNQLKIRPGDTSKHSNYIKIFSELAITESFIHLRKPNKAFSKLGEIEHLFEKNNSRGLEAYKNYMLAEAHSGFENLDNAIKYYEKSIEFLDIQTYPILLSILYCRLAEIYKYTELNFLARKFINKAIEIASSIGNIHYLSWFLGSKALLDINNGDLSDATKNIELSYNYTKQSGSKKEIFYLQEKIGMLHLTKNEYSLAHDMFTRSAKLESEIKHNVTFSSSKLYKLFIESKNAFDKSLVQMKNMIEATDYSPKPDLREYILASTLYLHSSNSFEKNEGEVQLKTLSDSSKYLIVRRASKKTLEEKKFYSVR